MAKIITKFSLLIAMMVSSLSANATQSVLQQAQNTETALIQQAAKSQTTVSHSSDKSMQLQQEIDSLKQQINNDRVYQSHLTGLIQSQKDEMARYNQQLSHIDETKESIVPLMYAMLDGLNLIVQHDKPIRLAQRKLRLKNLRSMMTESDVSDAEKYRRILEAYQIEMDYGAKVGSYTSQIIINHKPLMAEQLYIGRVSFIARTADKKHYWAWSDQHRQWVEQSSALYENLNKAFDVVNKQTSPELLALPISLSPVAENKS